MLADELSAAAQEEALDTLIRIRRRVASSKYGGEHNAAQWDACFVRARDFGQFFCSFADRRAEND